ncbi:MAG: hypothetical protein A2288_02300 [Candidatus Moranbacteria bacterium RIFOXYA12_FULL_44_15]|nr:MAG: hypothetical protein A2288_02300 [Candidatus Moranbacteria bacterium RIFOXYA12_FULL_44_15]OGI36414.1 MAG: hypothetical protein A2259_03380 [Candidatus Moranbacteria bacterium RIFOXYA2_FULL_43_15]
MGLDPTGTYVVSTIFMAVSCLAIVAGSTVLLHGLSTYGYLLFVEPTDKGKDKGIRKILFNNTILGLFLCWVSLSFWIARFMVLLFAGMH